MSEFGPRCTHVFPYFKDQGSLRWVPYVCGVLKAHHNDFDHPFTPPVDMESLMHELHYRREEMARLEPQVESLGEEVQRLRLIEKRLITDIEDKSEEGPTINALRRLRYILTGENL